MALIDSFPGVTGVVDSTELRKNLAGLIVRDTAGVPRSGVFPRHTNDLVTARGDMKVDIAAFEGVSVRGSGPLFMANDGVAQSPTFTAAPAANSRVDVLYFKQNENVSPYADASALPIFGIHEGIAGPGAVRNPAAMPAGAVELCTVTFPSTATATNSSGVAITQTCQFTATAGGIIMFRTAFQMGLYTTATPGQLAYAMYEKRSYVFDVTGWANAGGRTPYARAVRGADATYPAGTMTGLLDVTIAGAPAGVYEYHFSMAISSAGACAGETRVFAGATQVDGPIPADSPGPGGLRLPVSMSGFYTHAGGSLTLTFKDFRTAVGGVHAGSVGTLKYLCQA